MRDMSFSSFASDPSEIEWGPYVNDPTFRFHLWHEVVKERVYEKFVTVQNGDFVVDIGANIGTFPYTLQNVMPDHVVCVEPSKTLIPILTKNVAPLPFNVTILNCGLGSKNETRQIEAAYDYVYQHDETQTSFPTRTIQDIIGSIPRMGARPVDFLKIDCEGGEYDMFTTENYDFIRRNIKYIAGEFHIGPHVKDSYDKFMEFRAVYLKGKTNFKLFEIYHTPPQISSIAGRNLAYFWKDSTKECINDETYVARYADWYGKDAQFMIFINNH